MARDSQPRRPPPGVGASARCTAPQVLFRCHYSAHSTPHQCTCKSKGRPRSPRTPGLPPGILRRNQYGRSFRGRAGSHKSAVVVVRPRLVLPAGMLDCQRAYLTTASPGSRRSGRLRRLDHSQIHPTLHPAGRLFAFGFERDAGAISGYDAVRTIQEVLRAESKMSREGLLPPKLAPPNAIRAAYGPPRSTARGGTV